MMKIKVYLFVKQEVDKQKKEIQYSVAYCCAVKEIKCRLSLKN